MPSADLRNDGPEGLTGMSHGQNILWDRAASNALPEINSRMRKFFLDTARQIALQRREKRTEVTLEDVRKAEEIIFSKLVA